MDSFHLLNHKIQKVIYDMKWESFRPIQDQAISHLINTPSDLIISAKTASGKTEAAFLPIISKIIDNSKDSVKILYISPLKALINDQFQRITDLCKYINFPIIKWHGDANFHKKKQLLQKPAGILLITPESIESLIINKPLELAILFEKLEYIVMDEIHSFIGNERGCQLKSLIRRIENIIKHKPIKIALSATISNLKDVAHWINPQNPKSVKIIEDNSDNKKIVGIIKCYLDETLEEDLFKVIKKDKNLIFANNRSTLEIFCTLMQDFATKNNTQNIFHIHHGSISKNIRENTEMLLKKNDNISVFCTNTLELGIDIGNIDRIIFLLSPPFSVSSLIQRLGRCGRKENSVKEFRFFIYEQDIRILKPLIITIKLICEYINKENENNYSILYLILNSFLNFSIDYDDLFRTKLVQSIAMIELMLENFTEPLDTKNFDYSTLVHQILSYLGQTGGDYAVNIYNNIVKNSFDEYFSKNELIDILKYLNKEHIIYQMNDGKITLNKKGEDIVENYKFFAAFETPENWKIICNNQVIGELPIESFLSLKSNCFIFSGKKWEIVELKIKTKTIIVKQSYEGNLIKFFGSLTNVNRKIHQKMLNIYENSFIPKYIEQSAISILEEAFNSYKAYKNSSNNDILIVLEGSRIHNTLKLLLNFYDIEFSDFNIGFNFIEGKNEAIKKLKSIDFTNFNIQEILSKVPRECKYYRKFDYLLPDNILNKSYEQTFLDLTGTIEYIKTL